MLPAILQSSNSHMEVFVPQNKTNSHLKLMLEDNTNRYSKIARSARKSEYLSRGGGNRETDIS